MYYLKNYYELVKLLLMYNSKLDKQKLSKVKMTSLIMTSQKFNAVNYNVTNGNQSSCLCYYCGSSVNMNFP